MNRTVLNKETKAKMVLLPIGIIMLRPSNLKQCSHDGVVFFNSSWWLQ